MPRPKELDFATAPAKSKPGYQVWNQRRELRAWIFSLGLFPLQTLDLAASFSKTVQLVTYPWGYKPLFGSVRTINYAFRPGLINVRTNNQDDKYKKPQREAVIAKMLDSIEKDSAFRIDRVPKGTELQVMSTVCQIQSTNHYRVLASASWYQGWSRFIRPIRARCAFIDNGQLLKIYMQRR
jgi:hypothetical protein